MARRLAGRRAVVTEADDFMGPAVVELFREEGAGVFDDRRRPYPAQGQPTRSLQKRETSIFSS